MVKVPPKKGGEVGEREVKKNAFRNNVHFPINRARLKEREYMSQSGNEVVAEVKKAIGTRVAAYFGEKMFLGIVESVVAEDNGDSYRINWEDGDVEVSGGR